MNILMIKKWLRGSRQVLIWSGILVSALSLVIFLFGKFHNFRWQDITPDLIGVILEASIVMAIVSWAERRRQLKEREKMKSFILSLFDVDFSILIQEVCQDIGREVLLNPTQHLDIVQERLNFRNKRFLGLYDNNLVLMVQKNVREIVPTLYSFIPIVSSYGASIMESYRNIIRCCELLGDYDPADHMGCGIASIHIGELLNSIYDFKFEIEIDYRL